SSRPKTCGRSNSGQWPVASGQWAVNTKTWGEVGNHRVPGLFLSVWSLPTVHRPLLMRCPACDHPNPPRADECERCLTPLASLDVPTPHGPVETSLLNDPVSVLDPRPPVTVSADAALGQAVREMIDKRVGALLVTGASGELVGILTERDFLSKVVGVPDYE